MFGLSTTDSARDLSDEEILARSKAEPWLFTVLLERYQKCVKEGKRTLLLDPELFEQFGEMREHSGFAHDRDAIERVLTRLPGHFSKVLRLHYLEHWSHKDIAEETGETVGAIKARIHRAKAEFRKETTATGETASLL